MEENNSESTTQNKKKLTWKQWTAIVAAFAVTVIAAVLLWKIFFAEASYAQLWKAPSANTTVVALAVYDIDYDNYDETIFTDGGSRLHVVDYNPGSRTYTDNMWGTALPNNNMNIIRIGNMDETGNAEIVIASSALNNSLRVVRWTSGTTFSWMGSAWPTLSATPNDLAIGEFDNNASTTLDIAFANNVATNGLETYYYNGTDWVRRGQATPNANDPPMKIETLPLGTTDAMIVVGGTTNTRGFVRRYNSTNGNPALSWQRGPGFETIGGTDYFSFRQIAINRDTTSDGVPEVIIGTQNMVASASDVLISYNGASGGAPTWSYRSAAPQVGRINDIDVVDTNNDGVKDYIIAGAGQINGGDGNYALVLDTSGSLLARSGNLAGEIHAVEGGRLNGDNSLQLVAMTGSNLAGTVDNELYAFNYDGTATLVNTYTRAMDTGAALTQSVRTPYWMASGKINYLHDDSIDIAYKEPGAFSAYGVSFDLKSPVITPPTPSKMFNISDVTGATYRPTTTFEVYFDEGAYVTLKVYSDAARTNTIRTLATDSRVDRTGVATWVYSTTWNGSGNIGDGTYYYSVLARDNEDDNINNSVYNATYTNSLKVDFTAPFVSLTAPAEGATGLAGNVTIAGIVYDPNKDVADDSHFLNYTIDYRKVGETVYTPLTTGTTAYRNASTLHTWNTASPELNGNYVIRIVARDKFGHESLPVHRNINIKNDITPPNIALSYWKNYNSGTGVFSNPLPVYTSVYTKLQSVFIKVEANETLQANPTIAISGTGANTVASTLTTLTVNNMVYVYNWNVANAETLKAYTVSVAAKDKGDNNPLVSGNTSVIVDSSITNPTLSRVNGLGKITLNWTNSEGDHVAYHIFRSTSTPVNTGGVPDFVVSGPRSTWDDTTVAPHVTYYYKIKSVDAAENVSAESNEVSGVAPPGPPTLTVQYYSDASYTQLLPRDAASYYHAKAQNVYIRVSSNKALTGAPTFSIDAPSTVNDVTGRAMTLEGGNVYRGTLPWSVFAGADGNTQITFKGATAEGFDFAVTGVSPVVTEGGVVKIDTAVVVPTFILTDYGNQKITVKWNSNTDYFKMRIYRSNTFGFTANAGTLVGTTVSGEIYEDGPPTSGIWYYKLIAEDLAGNLSSVSEEKSKFFDKDITPPTLLSAESTSKQLLYLTFSENISINSVGGWTFTKYVNGVAGGNMAFTVYASAYELVPSDNRIVRITFNDSVFGNVYPLPISYRIVVNSVYDQGGLPVNPAANFAYWDGYTPHGKYAKVNAGDVNNTRLCGQCHVAHGSIGRQLLNRTTIQQVCFVCHGTAGTSLYKVQGEFARSAPYSASLHKSLDDAGQNVLFCTDCHNPHGEKKPGTNNLWAKLLKVPGVANSVYGNNFCLACHGPTNRIFKTGLTMNSVYNATTYYGYAAGDHTNPFAVHYDPAVNSGAMLPVSGTQVTCVKCHEKHGSQYGQLKDNTRANAEEEQCYKCHGKDANYSMTAGYNVYNMVTGAANKSRHTVFNTVNGKIECTSCHGPHTVDNAKFVSGAVYTAISDPDNTKLPYNTSGSRRISQFCIKCHDSAPPTAITNATTVVPYSITFNNPGFTTSGGGWNKDAPYSYLNSGHYLNTQMRGQTDAYGNFKNECTMCHEWHGTQYKWLVRLDEDKFGTDGVCLQCHQGSLYTAPAGITSLNVKSPLALTYSHPTTQAGFAGRHSNTEQYPWTSSGVSRHAQCNDCHDPHTAVSAKRSVNDETYLLGNVTGVNISNWNGATWANWATTTPTWSLQPLTDTSKQWQLCIKCHSKFAYSLDTSGGGSQDATGTAPFNTPSSVSGYTPGAFRQTDIAKEFNPANSAYHAVIGPSKIPTYVSSGTRYYGDGMFVNGWRSTSTLKCTDCHNKAPGDTGGRGPHGSSNRFLLIAPWNPTGAAGTWTGTTGTNSHLCFRCHNWNYYAGGTDGTTTNRSSFKDASRFNMHAIPNEHTPATRGFGCSTCHGGLPHGWRYANPLWGADAPRPYRDGVDAGMPASATGYTVAPGADWGDHTAGNCAGACGR